jgi:hypothetical protein
MLAVLAMVAIAAPLDAAVMCVKTKKGAAKEGAPIKLRASACLANETEVDPIALGLQGPAGTQGPAGAAGAQGTPGAPGLSGVEVVTAAGNAVVSASGTSTATASCPSGKKVIGGGVAFVPIVAGTVSAQRIEESRPVTTEPQGWTVSMTATVNEDWRADAHAVCATATD